MSEETPPAKKAARKSVRKKSASKRVSSKTEKASSEEQLPLTESAELKSEAAHGDERSADKQKSREPKSGVRDARRESSQDEDSNSSHETVEKLVPDPGPKEGGRDKVREQPKNRDNRDKDRDNRDKDRDNRDKDRDNRDKDRDNRDKDQDGEENGERRNGRNRGRNRNRNERGERNERPDPIIQSVDSKKLAKKAWQIFESEVTEEGLALLDDNGLREYARSSFNAARLFLEEASRVNGRRKEQEKPNRKKDDSDQERESKD